MFTLRKLRHYSTAFKKLTDQDISHFHSILEGSLLQQNLDSYNQDWMRKYKGNSQLVLRPKTTQQVSDILRYCNQENIAVVPQGGNTGLVGGSIPVRDEVIISMQLMNQIKSFDQTSGILTAEAGCVLETLDNWLHERGYMMPLGIPI
jgi:D-lactate dehydrogenase (cytochrome)